MPKFTVLLVDDIKENIYSLRLLIEDSFPNVNTLSALSAKDAILMLMKNNVDLILSDIQMPEINGFELIEYLQGVEHTREIPVILITGIHNSEEYQKIGFKKGAIDYISKPIDDELLCSKLKVFIDIFEDRRNDKEELAIRQKALNTQVKINALINNLDKLPEEAQESLNIETYRGILSNMENDINLDKVNEMDKKEH